jgi:hypothetical protein
VTGQSVARVVDDEWYPGGTGNQLSQENATYLKSLLTRSCDAAKSSDIERSELRLEMSFLGAFLLGW